MPDTHMKGDEKSEHISEEKRFAGEYVNLARYIGFSAFQKKVVSCTITGGLPVLLFGSFCFLLSFFVTSLSSCSESTLNAERFYKNPESMSGIIQADSLTLSPEYKHDEEPPQATIGNNAESLTGPQGAE